MDLAASLLNDTARSIYTYTAQLPYLRIAFDELKEFLEENNIPITAKVSAVLTINVGNVSIGFATSPALPADLIEIEQVLERTASSNEMFVPIFKQDYLPQINTLTSSLQFWAWQNQAINFLGANSIREVKIEYIADTLGTITDENTVINMINAKNYLAFRTAGLCAEFIGENKSRADSLNSIASGTLDRVLNISTKAKQAMPARRRPFRSAYKSQGGVE